MGRLTTDRLMGRLTTIGQMDELWIDISINYGYMNNGI